MEDNSQRVNDPKRAEAMARESNLANSVVATAKTEEEKYSTSGYDMAAEKQEKIGSLKYDIEKSNLSTESKKNLIDILTWLSAESNPKPHPFDFNFE